MQRRNCAEVITEMIKVIPSHGIHLKTDLEWNREDACYKAPEETIQWNRTQQTLEKHLASPTQNWEFEVLSIFTTISVDELKKSFKL